MPASFPLMVQFTMLGEELVMSMPHQFPLIVLLVMVGEEL